MLHIVNHGRLILLCPVFSDATKVADAAAAAQTSLFVFRTPLTERTPRWLASLLTRGS